ncbi:hypothetical protein HPC62_16190 [Thermoleptolyngbya sichuanensis A183]|uniref:Phage terminase large subunit GpA ATPase domain-containing protein n=1 Tax=Thermoleptolyngbya sichuanensis A183 TaxID=2737172 RepID=A0A6M8BKE7_9CYAN|nr:phage terminase large subunit family protein [Thermoleptolyngbya sichuanensis]QKD83533.1 hypothetical protein HPC62_16190 [Thermoleptolyngbya sichuanensis A183]
MFLAPPKPTRQRKRRQIENTAQRRRGQFSLDQSALRVKGIEDWYDRGGILFAEWARDQYRRSNGEPLHWIEPTQEEFYLLMGNPWVEFLVVEKPSQVGFTESLIAMLAFVMAEVKIPCGVGFEAERKLRELVPRIQSTFDFIDSIQKVRRSRILATGRKDTDHKERKMTVGGVECTFWYASTAAKNKQERQASSTLSSFPAWWQGADEIELYPEGVLDVAKKRMSASTLRTKPFRAGSTPGHEGGIVDSLVRASAYFFQWRVRCPHCDRTQFLDAFGNLLRPVVQETEDGATDERYVDITGRPLDWFCRDDSSRRRRIETAYIGCQHCGGELPDWAIAAISRTDSIVPTDLREPRGTGEFVCVNTGTKLRDLCTELIEKERPLFDPVALRLPRLASKLFNPAETMRDLATTRNPADAIQQGLGKAITIGVGKISLPRLQRACGLPLPDWCQGRSPDLVVLGGDQGRASHYCVRTAWYLPPDEPDPETRWLNAHIVLEWWGHLHGFDGVEDHVDRHDVDLVGFDGEPEIQLAAAYARKRPSQSVWHDRSAAASVRQSTLLTHYRTEGRKGAMFLFDQVQLKGEDFRRAERTIQDQQVPVFAMHRTFGLDAVRDRLYRGQLHLPEGLQYDSRDEDNLLLHLLASDRRTDGIWAQTPGMPDHFHHALCFAEVAVLAAFYEPRPKRLAFGSFKRN